MKLVFAMLIILKLIFIAKIVDATKDEGIPIDISESKKLSNKNTKEKGLSRNTEVPPLIHIRQKDKIKSTQMPENKKTDDPSPIETNTAGPSNKDNNTEVPPLIHIHQKDKIESTKVPENKKTDDPSPIETNLAGPSNKDNNTVISLSDVKKNTNYASEEELKFCKFLCKNCLFRRQFTDNSENLCMPIPPLNYFSYFDEKIGQPDDIDLCKNEENENTRSIVNIGSKSMTSLLRRKLTKQKGNISSSEPNVYQCIELENGAVENNEYSAHGTFLPSQQAKQCTEPITKTSILKKVSIEEKNSEDHNLSQGRESDVNESDMHYWRQKNNKLYKKKIIEEAYANGYAYINTDDAIEKTNIEELNMAMSSKPSTPNSSLYDFAHNDVTEDTISIEGNLNNCLPPLCSRVVFICFPDLQCVFKAILKTTKNSCKLGFKLINRRKTSRKPQKEKTAKRKESTTH